MVGPKQWPHCESKGFQIYWPNQQKVSIEPDMYFDKNQVLEPDEPSIEGVEDVFTNSDTSQSRKIPPDAPDESGACPQPVDNTTTDPAPAIVDNANNAAKNLPATWKLSTKNSQTPSNAPVPPPHQRKPQ